MKIVFSGCQSQDKRAVSSATRPLTPVAKCFSSNDSFPSSSQPDITVGIAGVFCIKPTLRLGCSLSCKLFVFVHSLVYLFNEAVPFLPSVMGSVTVT